MENMEPIQNDEPSMVRAARLSTSPKYSGGMHPTATKRYRGVRNLRISIYRLWVAPPSRRRSQAHAGKFRYKTGEDAQKGADRITTAPYPIIPYECSMGGTEHWHIGGVRHDDYTIFDPLENDCAG